MHTTWTTVVQPTIKNQHDLNSSVQVRQESQYETTCNGDLKLTAVFTTFGKVQKLEKGQPVSLPEDKKYQSRHRLGALCQIERRVEIPIIVVLQTQRKQTNLGGVRG